ncbi:hypothetical protein [Pelagibius sp. Alg239-R121]|uniref:hypothetical protein n=1 Tax=Pelagibius sp. Alg239-R121 TaxID=2993448 RepID=UPI0024A65664|nr:hypothetical protein [Pelagibius sp. Alg239-R121]
MDENNEVTSMQWDGSQENALEIKHWVNSHLPAKMTSKGQLYMVSADCDEAGVPHMNLTDPAGTIGIRPRDVVVHDEPNESLRIIPRCER